MKNFRVKFIEDLNFLAGNFLEGDEFIFDKRTVNAFSDYIEILGETDEDAINVFTF